MSESVNGGKGVTYFGKGVYAVDSSRRVLLPSPWRKEGFPTDYYVLPWPVHDERCLLVLPPPRFEQVITNLNQQSLTNEGAAALQRLIFSNTTQVSLDKVGRLALPSEGAELVAVGREAYLVGVGSRFEVWNPENYAARVTTMKPQAAAEGERIFI